MLPDAQVVTIGNWVTDDSPGVWESVRNVDSTVHRKVSAGDLIFADAHIVLVVPADAPGSDYRIRLVAIDDVAGLQRDTTLFERSLPVSDEWRSIELGVHAIHRPALDGVTRIQLFGYRALGTIGGVRVADGSHQRTIHMRKESA